MRSAAIDQALSRISAIQADLSGRIASLTPERTSFGEILSQRLSSDDNSVRYVRAMPENLALMQSTPVSSVPAESGGSKSGGLAQRMARYDPLVQEASEKYGLSPALVHAVIRAESYYDPSAVSPVGAQGLMQLMPGTAQGLGVSNSFDPVQNIDGGCNYLRQLLDRYNGDERLALAAYNCGPGRVAELGIGSSYDAMAYSRLSSGVRGYVDTVQHYKNTLA